MVIIGKWQAQLPKLCNDNKHGNINTWELNQFKLEEQFNQQECLNVNKLQTL